MSNVPPVHTPLHNFHYVESTVTREVPKDIGQIMTQSLHMGNYYWKKKRFFSPKQCLSLPIIFLPFCPLKKNHQVPEKIKTFLRFHLEHLTSKAILENSFCPLENRMPWLIPYIQHIGILVQKSVSSSGIRSLLQSGSTHLGDVRSINDRDSKN